MFDAKLESASLVFEREGKVNTMLLNNDLILTAKLLSIQQLAQHTCISLNTFSHASILSWHIGEAGICHS